MSQYNHLERWDAVQYQARCRCGAKYTIYKDDGTPGCRDVETFNCKFCNTELARHFGTCDGTLVDDSAVSESLKSARKQYDDAFDTYTKKHGYSWDTTEYSHILQTWNDAVNKALGE